MEHFKLLEEAAGNGHVVHGLRICEGFLKPVPQNCMELFRLEKTCRVIDSNHFPSTANSTPVTCVVMVVLAFSGKSFSGVSLVFCVTQTLGVCGSCLFVGLLSRFSSMGLD